ncbi:hypothetical protein [Candidatus Pelagibacter sp. HIMB1517]|uniref:hypothetical protein n=1 Tax=Candidatus Pelagibacter sp. HIMB1517 TaxID=3413341 RepID=UPI003F8508B1
MKILVIESVFNQPHLETSGEIGLSLLKKNKVYFSWLGENLPWSEWDLSLLSKVTLSSKKNRLKKFCNIIEQKGIQIVMPDIITKHEFFKINRWSDSFNGNLNDLKKFKFQNHQLGLAVSSSLISFFHNTQFDVKKKIIIVKKLLKSSAIVLLRAKKIIKKIDPDIIVTFNNRFATTYPIVSAGLEANKQVWRHDRGSSYNKYEIFTEDIHDLDYRYRKVKSFWDSSKQKTEKKIKEAKKYFNYRRLGKPLAWDLKKNHKKFQISGLDIKKQKKRRITFFTASEDEHESVKYQIKNLIWSNQFDVVKKLKILIKKQKDIELIIRVHPVSQNKKNNFDEDKWHTLEDCNTKVIGAKDKYDSYALLDSSDIIISYGGNIAIESTYWGKFTISLRKGIFSDGNYIYEPKNSKELKKLLSKRFKPKIIDKKKMLKFGWYFLNFGIKYKFYKPIDDFNGTFCKVNLSSDSKIKLVLKKIQNIFSNDK